MRTSQVRCDSRVEEYLMQTGGERGPSLSNNRQILEQEVISQVEKARENSRAEQKYE